LHPSIPFVTEELWDRFGYGEANSLIHAAWPEPGVVTDAASAREELDWVIRLIGVVRSVRTEMNVPPSKPSPVLLRDAPGFVLARAERWIEAIRRLARASDVLALAGDVPKGSALAVLDAITVVLPLEGLIDIAAERARLGKERDRLVGEVKKTRAKLDNPDFVARAKEEVVTENRERLVAFESEIARLEAALARLE
jgi:valyl-tRNA synthetase